MADLVIRGATVCDGTGAPAESLWLTPGRRTTNTFGFVKLKDWPNDNGSGSIRGTVKNEVGWPPNEVVTLGEPVPEPQPDKRAILADPEALGVFYFGSLGRAEGIAAQAVVLLVGSAP